jgi:hypothetical protein
MGTTVDIVAIIECNTGKVIDHFPIDFGATGFGTFEYYAADAGLVRCRRNDADAAAVLATVRAPRKGTPPSTFRNQIGAAAAAATVTFGFVRVVALDAA